MIIYVAVLMISIQMVLGNIIDPRLQGVQLNLSPFVILVALSLWGYIWGIAGMFLAVPITSVLQIICANVKSLRSVAIIISSGKGYRRQYEEEKARAKARRKAMQMEKKGKRAGTPDSNPASGSDAEDTGYPNRNVESGLYDYILPEVSRKGARDGDADANKPSQTGRTGRSGSVDAGRDGKSGKPDGAEEAGSPAR
jgi:hypothetical protein